MFDGTHRKSGSARALACGVLTMVLLALAGCASTGTRPAETGRSTTIQLPLQLPQADAEDAALLQRAAQAVREGRSQQALDGPLATLVAHYDARYATDGHHYFCAGSMPEAIIYLALASKAGVDARLLPQLWAATFFLQGFALEDLGQLEAGRAALARAVALSPMNAHYLNEAGYNAQARKQWSEALALYRRAEDAASIAAEQRETIEQTRALRGQGFVLAETGKLDQAEAAYRKSLTLDPRDRRAMRELEYIDRLRRTGQSAPTEVYRDIDGASGG